MMNIGTTCSCGKKLYQKDLIESLQVASNGMFQIRGECPQCRKWIEWVGYDKSVFIKSLLKAFYALDHDEMVRLHDLAIIDCEKKAII